MMSDVFSKFAISDFRLAIGAVLRCIGFVALPWCLGASAQAETLLLAGATVHTVSGESILRGQVLIKEGTIEAVGKSLKTPGARLVDLEGLHLYPGLIAPSTTLGLVEINAVRATRDFTEVGEYTPEVQSWIAVNPDSELLAVARANGITHAQPTPAGAIVAGQSGLIALDGWTMEQMTVRKPVALHVFWPSMDLDATPKEMARDRSKWKSLEDQDKERRKKLKALEDFFEEARAYAKARAVAQGNPAEFINTPAWEAMVPYVRGELPVMVHADEMRQILAAVNWAATNQYRIILAGGRDAWRVAGRLAQEKVPVIYEHTFTLPARDSDGYDAHFRAPAVLHAAGVTVAFSEGMDRFAATSVRNLPYSAAQAVAFGLPEEQALKGITLYPAQFLGVADRLGSVEAGKEATLFAADGNILDLRSSVKRMWIAGKEVGLDSRHTRLYQKYKSRPLPK